MVKHLWIAIVSVIALSSTQATQAKTQDLDIPSADGTKLRATYYNPGQPGAGLLLLHQCVPDASRKGWDGAAQVLMQSGFHVLTLDWRGFGESVAERPQAGDLKDFMGFIRRVWRPDLEAALARLRSLPGVDGDQIGTVGSSCGMLMSLELPAEHPEVKAQVLVTGPVDETALRHLAEAHVPTFGILSRDDPSLQFMERIEDATVPKKGRMLFLPEGAGHGAEIFDNYPEVSAMIAAWFAAHLDGV